MVCDWKSLRRKLNQYRYRLHPPDIYRLGQGKQRIRWEDAKSLANPASKPGIATITELWEAVGRDWDKGIDLAAKAKDMKPAELTDLLMAQARKEAQAAGAHSLGRHTLDLVFIAILVGVILPFLYRVGSSYVSVFPHPIAFP